MLDRARAQALEDRGFDVELLARLGVDASPLGSEWITIPFVAGGKVVNHKHRTVIGHKRFSQDKGGRQCLYNLDCLLDLRADHDVIITEGELDAWAALQAGYQFVVSVPGGAPSVEIGPSDSAKYGFLHDAIPLLKRARHIILATDNDAPGTALQHDLAVRLGKHRCKWLQYPRRSPGSEERCKDLAEVLQTYRAKGVVQTIEAARWVKIGGLYSLDELPPSPQHQAYRLGIAGLDDLAWLRAGDFWVVTGYPGDGKTTLLNEIAFQAVHRLGWRVCLGSFEQRQHDLRRAFRTLYSGKLARDMTEAEIRDADDWIRAGLVILHTGEDEERGLDWLFERMAAAVTQRDCRLVIIDPWNELEHDTAGEPMTLYVGRALKLFRRFCAKFQVPVLLSAHPRSLARHDGRRPIPELGDISDSAHWWNRPDLGVVVYRNGDETLIKTAKVKYEGEIGRRGERRVRFDVRTGRYVEIEPHVARSYSDD